MKSYRRQLIELFLFVAIGVAIFVFNTIIFVLMERHELFGLLFILTILSVVVWLKILYDKYL